MKPKTLFSVLIGMTLVMLLVTACGGAPGQSAAVQEAESTVKAFITAYEAKDTDKTMALFDQDAIYMDNGSPGFRGMGQVYVRNIRTIWAQTFQNPAFQMKFDSYFVSADGKHAALTATYTNRGLSPTPSSVPLVIILELSNGKIIREDDYYDSSPYE